MYLDQISLLVVWMKWTHLLFVTGLKKSRLPIFTIEESNSIKGSFDFLGVNFYTSSIACNAANNISDISFYADMDVSTYQVYFVILTNQCVTIEFKTLFWAFNLVLIFLYRMIPGMHRVPSGLKSRHGEFENPYSGYRLSMATL